LQYFIFFLFQFMLFVPPVLLLVWLVHRAKMPSSRVIFISMSVFGLMLGLMSALAGNGELVFNLNVFGMSLGDITYSFFINHCGEPHSFYAHYTIPWLLRTPQIYLLTTVLIWSLAGILAQVIYNVIKKPVAARWNTTAIMAASLGICLCVAVSTVYFSQDATHRYGPSQPSAIPLIQISIPPTGETGSPLPPKTYQTTTVYKVESLALSSDTVDIGESLNAAAVIKNSGSGAGMARIELMINGQVAGARLIALDIGDQQTVIFKITSPKTGIYRITVGDLSQEYEVKGK
jgi:hypothetical protein